MSWIATNKKTKIEYPITDEAKKSFEETGNDSLFDWREIKTPPEVAINGDVENKGKKVKANPSK